MYEIRCRLDDIRLVGADGNVQADHAIVAAEDRLYQNCSVNETDWSGSQSVGSCHNGVCDRDPAPSVEITCRNGEGDLAQWLVRRKGGTVGGVGEDPLLAW